MEERASILKNMKVCRFCLSNAENDLTNIHDKMKKDSDVNIPLPSLPLQIMACIAIEVIQNDNMPQYICNTCRNITTQAYIFKLNCKKADDALKLFLVTGQLSKPNMQNVVEIRVQPAEEKVISVIKEEVTNKSTDDIVEEVNEIQYEEANEGDEETDPLDINHEAINETQSNTCFPCTECDRSFPLKQLLDLHVKNHSRERNFECDVCQCKFYTKYDLQKHILTHNPNKEYECVVCHKTFAREPMLRRHEKIHTDAPKFECDECEKSFLTQEYLDFHMQKHNKKKPFTCNICNKRFVFKQGLDRHEAVHSENKPHKCNYCNAGFTTAIKLTRHITTHAGLRPYPCKICSRTFLLSHHLTRHMRSHYANKSSVEPVGQHKCDICSMSFRNKYSLMNHSAIHSMVNLKCVICNTEFETASLVRAHITTHLTDLPFSCEKCDYSFDTAEQLEEHELKHAEMEYEEQIEKEVFSESLLQEEDSVDQGEIEEGEIKEYTIVDVNDPDSSLRSSQEDELISQEQELISQEQELMELEDSQFESSVEYLKEEQDTEEAEEQVMECEQEDEEDVIETHIPDRDLIKIPKTTGAIKPIVRPEGTKMYERKNLTPKNQNQPELRLINTLLNKQPISQSDSLEQSNLLSSMTDPSSLVGKKVGDKIVKVKKFILTKDEMKAMAKQGIIEVKNGQVVVKSGSQQILNATLKPVPKTEIDSLLDKRQSGSKFQIKKYDKKTPGKN